MQNLKKNLFSSISSKIKLASKKSLSIHGMSSYLNVLINQNILELGKALKINKSNQKKLKLLVYLFMVKE